MGQLSADAPTVFPPRGAAAALTAVGDAPLGTDAPTAFPPRGAAAALTVGDAPVGTDAPTTFPPRGAAAAFTAVGDAPAGTDAPTAFPSRAAAAVTAIGDAPVVASGILNIGQAFGLRYRITKLLGVGGMGAVYEAWDQELGVPVALKVIRIGDAHPSESSDLEKRFKHELLIARQVTHKNVVRIHDLGEIDGIKYITMPRVNGDDLATVLHREGRLPIARALQLARQIVSGLEAAHEAGVVHRDLKPANIMISGNGDGPQALIMDFGISASTRETHGAGVVGTLEYMAPEQASGGAVDARADVYAFGLILYEMLTGPRQSNATTVQERFDEMKQRFEAGVKPIRDLDSAIPEPLAGIVSRCLERDPAARYESAAQLGAALAQIDDRGELIPVPPRFGKRVLAASALTLLLVIAATYELTRTPPPPKPHDPVAVLIADVQNRTGDPAFDRTLEPVLRMALEGAGFISGYDRTQVRRSLGVRPPDRLDEAAAREIAIKQGVGVVLSGSLDRRGSGYALSLHAKQAVTGGAIADTVVKASSKDQVLAVVGRAAAVVRKSLGDNTSDTAQRFAMDTLSATSLDVVREYAAAMEAVSNSRFDQARQNFANAVKLDPNFGLAYAGMAMMSQNLGQQQSAAQYVKEAVRHVDRMTERERYRTRGLFYLITGDYEACAKEYSDLLARYAADPTAHNNLALCSTELRNLPKAVEEMRRVVQILPKRALYHVNLGLYANYAGDFATGEREARVAQELGSPFAPVPLAFAQLGSGQLALAVDTYQRFGTASALGASHMAAGLADLAVYQGRFADGARLYERGAAADLTANQPDRAAAKLAALAYTETLRGRAKAAIEAAEQALTHTTAAKIRFMAARTFVDTGQIDRARALAAALGAELQTEPQAYGKLIEGAIALKSGDARSAIKIIDGANRLLDTWIGRFDLGRAYLTANAFTQADSEFDRCLKRRGESLALFLDEEPTFRYLPAVYYYEGRVHEGLQSPGGAVEAYRTYLNIRGASTEDPLLRDVRRRAGEPR